MNILGLDYKYSFNGDAIIFLTKTNPSTEGTEKVRFNMKKKITIFFPVGYLLFILYIWPGFSLSTIRVLTSLLIARKGM